MAQTEPKSCKKFNPFRLRQSKKRIWGKLYEIKYFFLKDWNILRVSKIGVFSLKTEIFLEFLRLGSKLFDSIIADRKKEFLKKLCFVLIRGILPTVLVAYGVLLKGIRFGVSPKDPDR